MPLLTVEICARPPHTAFLVVSYNGKTPPHDLFADLEMLGWNPPTVAPPPKIAIDWNTPDPEMGTRFTVRDYLVEGAVVEPPAGSGPRSSWAPGERTLLLAPLDRVLARHDVHVIDRIGGLQRRASAPTLPPPPAPAAGGPSAAVAPAPEPAPVATGWAAADLPEGSTILVEALPPPPQIAKLDRALTDLDVGVSFTTEEYTAYQSFRGSSVPTVAVRCRLTALVPPTTMDAVLAVLATSGVEPDVRVLTPEESDAMLAAADDDDEADELARARGNHPCLHLVVDPPMVESVIDEIGRLGLDPWQRVTAEIRSVGVFRGSQNVTVRPAAGFEIWVPLPDVDAVAQQLAAVARVDATNPDRCWITDPEPPDVATTDTDGLGAEPDADVPPTGSTDPAVAHDVDDLVASTPSRRKLGRRKENDRVVSEDGDRVLTRR